MGDPDIALCGLEKKEHSHAIIAMHIRVNTSISVDNRVIESLKILLLLNFEIANSWMR